MEKFLDDTQSTTEYEIESTESITNQINSISEYVQKNKRNVDFRKNVSEEFSEFEHRYPTLFRKLVEDDCDRQQLNFMLSKLEQVRSGNQSQHDASVDVGQVLVDKFVKPELAKKNKNSNN
tara:strand:+ start:811 stop:1173 length:363 start_codon:yes stop_codon:yes gene_type:complete